MNEIIISEYEQVKERINQAIIEGEFASNWALIETYHLVGKEIKENTNLMPVTDLIKKIADDLGKKERTLFYAYKFYDMYPDINMLPEGKNARWYRIKQKYLTEEKLLHDDAVKSEPEEIENELRQLENKVLVSKSGRITYQSGDHKFTLSLVKEKTVNENGSQVNDLIALFEPVNPSFEQLFKISAQRQAMERLLIKHTKEKLIPVINALPKIIGLKYAPRVTTPVQLENKLGELHAFIKQQQVGGYKDGLIRKIQ